MESDINNRIKKAIKRVKKRPHIKNLATYSTVCGRKMRKWENGKMVDSVNIRLVKRNLEMWIIN